MEADRAAEIRKMFLDALDGTDTQSKTAPDIVKNSIAHDFVKKYDNWDKKDSTISFRIGTTSDVLRQLGVDVKNIYWDSSKIIKIKKNHPSMTDGVIKQVPQILERPILVMRSLTNSSRITLLGEVYDSNGTPVLAVLELNAKDRKGTSLNVIKIASAYGKDSNLQGFINRSQILYIDPDKERTRSWFVVNRLQLPLLSTNYGFVDPSLSQNQSDVNNSAPNNDVNTKNSLKLTDSEGNELSAEQQEFFKNSKVRDEDGNLLVVYHGTDADFTVFDRTKGRSAMDIQGSFFSPWELDAQGYGSEVKPYYLNITNPASEGVAYKALNRFKGQNYAGVKAREYLESLGYDGVNNGNEEYIAFYPQQIKAIENLNPTDNPDIRYSLKNINQNEVDKEKKKGNNKKRNYNEADTLFMQWSNSPSIPVGERKIFKRGSDWVWFKKAEDGCIELFRNKNKEVVRKYERAHRKTDERIRQIIGKIRSDVVRSGGNNNLYQLSGDSVGNGGQIGSERLQTDTEGNRKHLRSGVRGISDVTDTETKSSLRHSLGIIDENPANQSLIAQNEAFRRIISEQQHVLNRHFVDSKKVRTINCGYHKKRTAETPSILFKIFSICCRCHVTLYSTH